MAQVGSLVVRALGNALRAETGLAFAVAQIAEREGLPTEGLPMAPVLERNIAAEMLEKRTGADYPSLHVYCERLDNELIEKFRTFSGTAHMVVEIRVSQDHVAGLEQQMRLYVDAVTQVLDFSRGDWGNGMFYGGVYRVDFQPIKHGGKNYLQTARVTFGLKVSMN